MSDNYPSDWDKKRKQVYKRDNYACQNCGREGGPKGGTQLEAHHIVPISKGGTHRISNLKTLCEDCHNAVHGKTLAPTGRSLGNISSSSNISSSKNDSSNGDEELGLGLAVFGFGGMAAFPIRHMAYYLGFSQFIMDFVIPISMIIFFIYMYNESPDEKWGDGDGGWEELIMIIMLIAGLFWLPLVFILTIFDASNVLQFSLTALLYPIAYGIVEISEY